MEKLIKQKIVLVRVFMGVLLFFYFLNGLQIRAFLLPSAQSFRGLPYSFVIAVYAAGLLASLVFAFGFGIRMTSAICIITSLLSVWISPFMNEVHYTHRVLVLLTFLLFIGKNANLEHEEKWQPILLLAVYFGFSLSGAGKFLYHGWWSGEVVNAFCPISPIATYLGKGFCAYLPSKLLGYVVIFIQLSSFPLILFSRTRLLSWTLNSLLHFGVLIFMWVYPVSLAILTLQLLLFRREWLRS